jgi:hypothetical protein
MTKVIITATVMHTSFMESTLDREQLPLSAQINVSILGSVPFRLNIDPLQMFRRSLIWKTMKRLVLSSTDFYRKKDRQTAR